MKTLMTILFALGLVSTAQALPIIPQNLIVPGNNGAWEWVWIAPCSPPDGAGCSLKPGVEVYGFGNPVSTAQWTDSFTGYTGMFNSFVDFTTLPFPTARCAASFFSQEHTACNPGDLAAGAIHLSPFVPIFPREDLRGSASAESFWVRASAVTPPVIPPTSGTVPETSSLVSLAIGLLGLMFGRVMCTKR